MKYLAKLLRSQAMIYNYTQYDGFSYLQFALASKSYDVITGNLEDAQ